MNTDEILETEKVSVEDEKAEQSEERNVLPDISVATKSAKAASTPKKVTNSAATSKTGDKSTVATKKSVAKPTPTKSGVKSTATKTSAEKAKAGAVKSATQKKPATKKPKSPLKNKKASDIEDDYGLKLFFQPIYIASENRVFGYECLLRIVDKELGVITPDAFLNVAKKNASLMHGLEEWSMREVFRTAKLFRANRKYIDMISLNIDTANFFKKDFYDRISKYFDKINESIYLELKEDAFFSTDPSVAETIDKLRAAGIKIAVDDFTANFLTFEWEDKLPFDMIKIDRAFIDRFMISPKARLIIEKIIEFAKKHNVDIVAVGVENAEQERELMSMGCEMLQGYYYAKPLQIKRLLTEDKTAE